MSNKKVSKILFLYSTEFEVSEFKKNVLSQTHKKGLDTFIFENIGVGQTSASCLSIKAIENYKPDIIINIGIAGAFRQSEISIGDIVFVENDIIENAKDTAKTVKQYDFEKEKYFIDNKSSDLNNFSDLTRVSSLTVSLVSSNIDLADKRYDTFKADIETMEGGSISFVIKEFFPSIQYYQIRSISNFTGDEKMIKNNLMLSISKLNKFLIKYNNYNNK